MAAFRWRICYEVEALPKGMNVKEVQAVGMRE